MPEHLDAMSRPLHDLRISVMDRCNFRCPYCMPEDKYHPKFRFLDRDQRLTFTEIGRLTRLFVQLGAHKLRITGGEPLLRTGVADLIADLSQLDGVSDVAMTTNAVLLAQHAAKLAASGLSRVTVSLDALDEETFSRTTGGRGGVARVLDGIDAAVEAGLTPIKVNAVVERGVNDHAVLSMVEHFRGTGIIVRFIEYMDVGNINHWRRRDMVPSAELLQMIAARWPLTPVDANYHGEVANRYHFDDGNGEIGFISSVTEPFCGSCTRARLSSDGQMYTCLFASEGLDLRTPLRGGVSDQELLELITAVWQKRKDRYSELRAKMPSDADPHKVEMYYIGG
ncbi:MAG: GTP 3',8-cyclase MoaA [Gammaproteobacteria bacterium]|nr:GTP 3',8-cyclase MoaA [Gammaproteobacteria bacterium]MDH3768054.1 GTP 3',8-cyclase MoaA [Gammaproteobacteria bacterium]